MIDGLEFVKKTDDEWTCEIEVPFGLIALKGASYIDKDGKEKEITDFNKNKIKLTTMPTPLLPSEKEQMVRKKEDLIRDKEIALKKNIIIAEKEVAK